jgi:hypothetical protein
LEEEGLGFSLGRMKTLGFRIGDLLGRAHDIENLGLRLPAP